MGEGAHRACGQLTSLVDLESEPAHDSAPAVDLIRIEFGKLLTGGRAGFESKGLNPLCEAGGFHDPHQLSIEPVENRLRRAGRGIEAGPKRAEKPGPPQLR